MLYEVITDIMSFVIDGLSYRLLYPPMVNENTGKVEIEGPFDEYTSKALVHYSKPNYEIFNLV